MLTMTLLVLIMACLRGGVAEDAPLVQTSLGKISGFYRTSLEGRLFSAFEGIPFATPPVGDLRFEAPQPVSAWDHVLNASTQYTCKQAENPLMPGVGGKGLEDCLYLNVYSPKINPSESDNYDVIVNIHGGAFMAGDSSIAGPQYIMDRDIIYVNANYRLGILGFLSTEDEIIPGNNGLKDQQLALKWVKMHIKQFGGNPNSITLMGLSSGGVSVHLHYFSAGSKGLFHKGISQSGNALLPWALQEGALHKTKKLADYLNCKASNTQAIVDCLKTIPVDDIVKSTKHFYDIAQFPITPFGPVVEVESPFAFLTKSPYEQLQDGEVSDVPWLATVTKDEGIGGVMFLARMLSAVEKHWDEWSEHFFDYKYACKEAKKKEIARKIKSFYFQNEKISKSNLNAFINVFSDRMFKVGFETSIQMQAKVVNSPIYAGIYGYTTSINFEKIIGKLKGVPHAAESILIHDSDFMKLVLPELNFSKADIAMKNVLIDLFTSFAKDGKPQATGVDWKAFTPNYHQYLYIHDHDNVTMVEIPNLTPKEFWMNLDFMENGSVHDEL